MGTYGGAEMASSFETVRGNTIQIANDIPEANYDFVAAPGMQSVRALLVHIAMGPTLYEDMHRYKHVTTLVGYDFPGIIARVRAAESKPRVKAEIVALLKSEGERFSAWLRSLSPEFLAETFTDNAGHAKTRLEGLLSPKEHEMHHRGQLMVVERMLGIVPHLTRQREERARHPVS